MAPVCKTGSRLRYTGANPVPPTKNTRGDNHKVTNTNKSIEIRIPAVNTGTSDIVAISFFDRGEYTTIHTADARGNYQEFSVPTHSLIKAAAFLKAK
jgi:hypothetical protein